ncbi:hypothetical protein [Nocardioides alcanivorans]|uniref:hypothetical protein n=1 Tax=Nocardioides alcanivorans TaxID=2897352 RepID=UPI001F40E78C|nr:hypothetical protein [Nocardioides alcanivorans]
MTFQDLPQDWSDHSLTRDLLPDVVDLFVGEAERLEGCLALLLLDSDRRLVQPIVISEMGDDAPSEDVSTFFAHLVAMIEDEDAHVVAARGRLGPAKPSEHDAEWGAFLRLHLGRRLAGLFLATPDSVVELTGGSAAA